MDPASPTIYFLPGSLVVGNYARGENMGNMEKLKAKYVPVS